MKKITIPETINPSDLLEIANEADRELARTYYEYYVQYVHGGRWFPHPHSKIICKYIQDLLDDKFDRLIISMPPRHGKSMTVTETLPSYFLGRNPDKKVIIVSYSATLAEDFGLKNRQKLDKFGKELFGVEVAPEKSSQKFWKIKNYTGQMNSMGIDGTATGFGGHLFIFDDPHKNRQEAESETMRNNVINFYKGVAYNRLEGKSKLLVIMTRWHENDLVGWIQELDRDEKRWISLTLPAICDSSDDPLGRAIGEPLWDKDYEDIRKNIGAREFASQHQQRPAPADGTLFRREWWRYYDAKPVKFDQTLQSWDLTFKDGVDCDYVVGQTWGVQGANRYLLDQIRAKMGFVETLEAIRSAKAKWSATSRILIEDKANGSAVISSLKNEIPGIIGISPKDSKFVRAQSVTPLLEAGNVFIPNPGRFSWVDDFIEECANFPNGRHDDQVDAMTQVLNYLRQNKVAKLQYKTIDTGIDWKNGFI